ncbi:hypothetical protein vseg_005133 [Gypsophila vaccaria]
MKPMNFHFSSCISFLISFLIIYSTPTIESSTSSNTTVIDDYIRKCCNVTLYTSLCYSSLSGQYIGPADDLGNLTCAAIEVSLTEATVVAHYVASVNSSTGTSQVGPAFQDCTKLTKATISQVRQSLYLMVKIVDAYVVSSASYNETEKQKMKFELNSVQTWMSAGITDQSTCMQGFKDVDVKDDDHQLEQQVYDKVWVVIKLISNALALVNSYVDNISRQAQILI